ncbi:hypothetical protein JHK82_016167 [Glycine max]|nr:hypothetical protein JHK86_016198 [Glycine max]KAG5149286.1 hypothetical protein JHK82_016167 [Glycine max]
MEQARVALEMAGVLSSNGRDSWIGGEIRELVNFGLARLFSLSGWTEVMRLVGWPFAQRTSTTHPSSRFFLALRSCSGLKNFTCCLIGIYKGEGLELIKNLDMGEECVVDPDMGGECMADLDIGGEHTTS